MKNHRKSAKNSGKLGENNQVRLTGFTFSVQFDLRSRAMSIAQ
jgi:hypothetical protein